MEVAKESGVTVGRESQNAVSEDKLAAVVCRIIHSLERNNVLHVQSSKQKPKKSVLTPSRKFP